MPEAGIQLTAGIPELHLNLLQHQVQVLILFLLQVQPVVPQVQVPLLLLFIPTPHQQLPVQQHIVQVPVQHLMPELIHLMSGQQVQVPRQLMPQVQITR